jgi:hypothetical protein
MFWDIHLRDRSYACGRVLSVEGKHRKRSPNMFWGALLRWHSISAPTAEAIAGAPVLWQGNFNIRSFRDCKSRILGLLPLEDDGIEIPPILTTTLNGEVMVGYDVRRPATDAEYRSLPVKTCEVSNQSFREIAEDVFLDGKPMRWDRSPDQNALLDSLGLQTPRDLNDVVTKVSREWQANNPARGKESKSRTRRHS